MKPRIVRGSQRIAQWRPEPPRISVARGKWPCASPHNVEGMSSAEQKRLNWWAAVIGFGMILPIAWLSFDNFTSAIIMAGAAAIAGLFLFPVKAR